MNEDTKRGLKFAFVVLDKDDKVLSYVDSTNVDFLDLGRGAEGLSKAYLFGSEEDAKNSMERVGLKEEYKVKPLMEVFNVAEASTNEKYVVLDAKNGMVWIDGAEEAFYVPESLEDFEVNAIRFDSKEEAIKTLKAFGYMPMDIDIVPYEEEKEQLENYFNALEQASTEDSGKAWVVVDEDGKIVSRASDGTLQFLDTVDLDDGGLGISWKFKTDDEATVSEFLDNFGINKEGWELMTVKDAFAFLFDDNVENSSKVYHVEDTETHDTKDMNIEDLIKLMQSTYDDILYDFPEMKDDVEVGLAFKKRPETLQEAINFGKITGLYDVKIKNSKGLENSEVKFKMGDKVTIKNKGNKLYEIADVSIIDEQKAYNLIDLDTDEIIDEPMFAHEISLANKNSKHKVYSDDDPRLENGIVVIDEDGKILTYLKDRSKQDYDFLDTVDDEDGGFSRAVIFQNKEQAKDALDTYEDLTDNDIEFLTVKEAFAFVEESSEIKEYKQITFDIPNENYRAWNSYVDSIGHKDLIVEDITEESAFDNVTKVSIVISSPAKDIDSVVEQMIEDIENALGISIDSKVISISSIEEVSNRYSVLDIVIPKSKISDWKFYSEYLGDEKITIHDIQEEKTDKGDLNVSIIYDLTTEESHNVVERQFLDDLKSNVGAVFRAISTKRV